MNTSTPSRFAAHADSLALDQQLCFALYAASLAMTKVYRQTLSDLNLTYPQYLVMLLLWESEGHTVSGLGDRLGLDSATLTPLLKRLEAAGLLTRRRGKHDERSVEIGLTESGMALRERARTVPPCMLEATGCTAEGAAELKDQLDELRRQLLSSLR